MSINNDYITKDLFCVHHKSSCRRIVIDTHEVPVIREINLCVFFQMLFHRTLYRFRLMSSQHHCYIQPVPILAVQPPLSLSLANAGSLSENRKIRLNRENQCPSWAILSRKQRRQPSFLSALKKFFESRKGFYGECIHTSARCMPYHTPPH